MHLHNEEFEVEASVDKQPVLEQYDIVLNPAGVDLNGFYMARYFHVLRTNGQNFKIALIDSVCSEYELYAILEGHVLTTILFDAIVRIDLDTGLIVQYEVCGSFGGLFEIHYLDRAYFLWGEEEIYRYDSALKQIWRFSGRDILVSRCSQQHFWIRERKIHCRDFAGWHYILDLDGNLIEEFCEFEEI